MVPTNQNGLGRCRWQRIERKPIRSRETRVSAMAQVVVFFSFWSNFFLKRKATDFGSSGGGADGRPRRQRRRRRLGRRRRRLQRRRRTGRVQTLRPSNVHDVPSTESESINSFSNRMLNADGMVCFKDVFHLHALEKGIVFFLIATMKPDSTSSSSSFT